MQYLELLRRLVSFYAARAVTSVAQQTDLTTDSLTLTCHRFKSCIEPEVKIASTRMLIFVCLMSEPELYQNFRPESKRH
jgi:hypothetical protein